MKKLCFSLIIIILLPCYVHAQNAEDLIRNQSSGVTYSRSGNGVVERLTIRGDRLTHRNTGGGLNPNSTFTFEYRIINKFMDGNKIILQTDGQVNTKVIIDGNVAVSCSIMKQGLYCDHAHPYMREQ